MIICPPCAPVAVPLDVVLAEAVAVAVTGVVRISRVVVCEAGDPVDAGCLKLCNTIRCCCGERFAVVSVLL